MPPIRPRIPDSYMNIFMMLVFLAPIAFITPISFVLSRTEVYIVFIIFTEATISDIRAMRSRTLLRTVIIEPNVSSRSVNVWT